MERRSGGVTIVFVPDLGGESRSIRLSKRNLRRVMVLGVVGLFLVGGMVTSWWYLAFHTARSWTLQARVEALEEDRNRLLSLAEELNLIEQEYERIRLLFGSSEGAPAQDLWLPPSGLPGIQSTDERAGPLGNLPSSWPLTAPGYITQPLVEGDAGDHPGLDIAIPTDSYIRAAGAGRVVRVGEDTFYGFFVVLEHGNGYQSVYAHASTVLVERGQLVRREEVIG